MFPILQANVRGLLWESGTDLSGLIHSHSERSFFLRQEQEMGTSCSWEDPNLQNLLDLLGFDFFDIRKTPSGIILNRKKISSDSIHLDPSGVHPPGARKTRFHSTVKILLVKLQ